MDQSMVEPDLQTLLTTNALPGPFTTSFIRRSIDRIVADIARTYSTVFYLTRTEATTARRLLVEKKRRYESVISAVRRIPAELWAKIFLHNADDPTEFSRYRLVSKSWQMATFQPVLWTHVGIVLYHDQEHGCVRVHELECIMDHLTMTPHQPLDVDIVYDFPSYLFNAGTRVFDELPGRNRWRSLTSGPGLFRVLMRPDCGLLFPRLEEIVLSSHQDDEDVEGIWMLDLPRLQRVTIKVRGGVDIDNITLPWRQLTKLSLDAQYSDASDYLEILAQCHLTLEFCEIKLNESPYPTRLLPFSGGRMTMSRLRKFKLISNACPAFFLLFLRMPELDTFEIGWEMEDCSASAVPRSGKYRNTPGKQIADFIRASGCGIRKFTIQGKDVRYSDVGEALYATRKTLKDVTLLISNSPSMPAIDYELDINALRVERTGDGDDEEASALHDQALFPRLEDFTIHSSFFAIPLSWFMGFVQPRTLRIEEPCEIDYYRERNCVSFIYESGTLSVISGQDLTKGMLREYIEGGYEGVLVLA